MKGSRKDAQDELGTDMICGDLPQGFDPKSYQTKPWKISGSFTKATKSNSAAARSKFSPRRVTPPARCLFSIGSTDCFSPATPIILAASGLSLGN